MPPPLDAAAAFGIVYRPERDDDYPFIRELFIATRAEEVAATGWPIETQRAFLVQQCDAQRSHYRTSYIAAEWLVIERGGEAIGRLYLNRAGSMTGLLDIALIPAARGGGIGSAIVADVLAEAARADRPVEIYVEVNNPARRIYDRLGFVPHESNGIYDRMTWRKIS